jgi:predicted ATP-grasp superfamily ATP-dependent carboligase
MLTSRSRWYRAAPGAEIDETSDTERLASYLRSLPFARTVLFPCSDRWALAVAGLPPEITTSHAVTVAPLEVLQVMIDKELFAQAAARSNVPAPQVLGTTMLDSLGDGDLHAFFLKPRNSQRFAERFGVKAVQLESKAHAAELVERMRQDGVEFLLQEFVPGPPTSHVFIDGYVDRAGVMRACLARRRLRMHPPEFGNSTMSVTIAREEVSEAIASLRRLFEDLGYFGLFDAEFKQDARDGRFKILEVNARPWWQLELSGAAGLDVCTMAYRDAIGQPLPRLSAYKIGKTWVHPGPDLKAWWAGHRHGEQTGPFPLRAWFGGANAVFSWDDPKPAGEELARLAIRVVSQRRSRAAARKLLES